VGRLLFLGLKLVKIKYRDQNRKKVQNIGTKSAFTPIDIQQVNETIEHYIHIQINKNNKINK